jgi:hypothetical protein
MSEKRYAPPDEAPAEQLKEPDLAMASTATVNRSEERRMLALLVLVCGLLIGGGVALPIATGATTTPSPVTLGDVSEAHIVEIRNQRGIAVLSGEFRSRVDVLGNTEKDAALTDRLGRTVIGEVELEIPAPSRENRRAELEVDIIGLAARETFTVAIDDRIVGTFTTDDRGCVDMELQEGEIPAPVSEI